PPFAIASAIALLMAVVSSALQSPTALYGAFLTLISASAQDVDSNKPVANARILFISATFPWFSGCTFARINRRLRRPFDHSVSVEFISVRSIDGGTLAA